MIKLAELISLAGVKLDDFKIHCASGYTVIHPLKAFLAGNFKQWQEEQNQKNFECREIVSLIHLEGERWLFAGVYTVKGVSEVERTSDSEFFKARSGTSYQYETEEVDGLGHLTGRVIVRFNKNFRAVYLVGKTYIDQLLVSEIRDQRMTIGDFPGYKVVILSHDELKTIVCEDNPSWKTALSHVAGIYLITDTSMGKLYVGSAYGEGGIWQRWLEYAQNGHGGNKELRKILRDKGESHVTKFQFSLLEVCDLQTGAEAVIPRENHWKQVLKTREHGMNSN